MTMQDWIINVCFIDAIVDQAVIPRARLLEILQCQVLNLIHPFSIPVSANPDCHEPILRSVNRSGMGKQTASRSCDQRPFQRCSTPLWKNDKLLELIPWFFVLYSLIYVQSRKNSSVNVLSNLGGIEANR